MKTYREGNKGSKRMTRKQVYLRVEAQAAKLGLKPPSHMTVYRVLQPIPLESRTEKKYSLSGVARIATISQNSGRAGSFRRIQ